MVYDAQYQLLRAYMQKLDSCFSQSDASRRRSLLNSLDKIVGSCTLDNLAQSKFDHINARKVRESLGLTLRELSEELEIKSPQTISNYERGLISPFSGKNGAKYLTWVEQAKKSKNP